MMNLIGLLGYENRLHADCGFPGLKELTISVKVPYNAGVEQLSRENPFISMISVWYALELLPGLRTTFLCEPSDFEGNSKFGFGCLLYII